MSGVRKSKSCPPGLYTFFFVYFVPVANHLFQTPATTKTSDGCGTKLPLYTFNDIHELHHLNIALGSQAVGWQEAFFFFSVVVVRWVDAPSIQSLCFRSNPAVSPAPL